LIEQLFEGNAWADHGAHYSFLPPASGKPALNWARRRP
jgi:hypothetical protein